MTTYTTQMDAARKGIVTLRSKLLQKKNTCRLKK